MKIMEPLITSRKNLLITETAALHDKKYRDERNCFLIEGEKLVLEAADRALPVECILVSEEKTSILPRLQERYGRDLYRELPVYTISRECFLKISSEKSPQGVIARIKHLDFFRRMTIIYDEDIFSIRDKRIIMVYAMQDPGNLGAVIRSAVAFGAECIVMSENCADVYNSKTIRAAMGSMFHVNTYTVSDFAGTIRALQGAGRRVLAAELRTNSVALSDIKLTPMDCVLIGNEGHGIPEDISDLCNAGVYLPITSGAESLNAAVAAGIFMWEQSKQ